MTNQSKLETILKHKGIGPAGSKSLKEDQLQELQEVLIGDTSLITQASLYSAFCLLENQPHEQEWFDVAKEKFFHKEVREMQENAHPLGALLKRVLNRENLSYEESLKSVDHLLDLNCPEFLKGAFLEGQRVKRETHEENLGFLHGLHKHTDFETIDSDVVIDIADNYDGYNRTPCLSPFVAAILAACGYKTIIHGVKKAAPKMGKTSYEVLECIEYPVEQSLKEAKSKLEDPNIGWAYVDQSKSYPQLNSLINMRKEMVKRPMLATFEKMVQPLRATEGNYLAMGYTHTAYKGHLSKLIVEFGATPKTLIIRGVEGTSRPSLARRSVCLWYDGDDVHEEFFDPKEYGIETREEVLDKKATAKDSCAIGLDVLNGLDTPYRDYIVYWATALLSGFRLETDIDALKKVEEAIDSKQALKHLVESV